MHIEHDVKLDFCDVLLKPKRSTISSRSEIDLTRTFAFKHSKQTWTGVPIISANMASVTTPEVVEAMAEHQMLACLDKKFEGFFSAKTDNYVIASSGLTGFATQSPYPFLCLDVANGYTQKFVDCVSKTRDSFPARTIIAGNVVSPEMVEALLLAGADIIKIGLGSGAACATRIKTSIGYPQLSAVIDCADSAHGLGGFIISDGGCTKPGDIVTALAAGGDFVMLGSMLAGCTENGTEFYGSSSKRAMGNVAAHRTVEGWELELPAKGSIHDVLQDIEGGLRSACSYCGAKRLKDLPKCATLILVNRQANTSLWEHRI